ncbi:MAG: transcriptional regulator [Candidatus Thorarchaeota archaeon]|jgi:predicted transcriptional regulator
MSQSKPKQRKVRKWLMPQEVEVWYILPALRRELAKVMKSDRGQAQKTIARILGVTEPAVTQYMLSKKDKPKRSRGDQVKVPESLKPELLKSADAMIEAWSKTAPSDNAYETTTMEINRLIEVLRDAGVLCDIHREHCQGVHMDCNACGTE